MGILEKISEIEKEISRTQKNKGKLIKGNILYSSQYNPNLSYRIPFGSVKSQISQISLAIARAVEEIGKRRRFRCLKKWRC